MLIVNVNGGVSEAVGDTASISILTVVLGALLGSMLMKYVFELAGVSTTVANEAGIGLAVDEYTSEIVGFVHLT